MAVTTDASRGEASPIRATCPVGQSMQRLATISHHHSMNGVPERPASYFEMNEMRFPKRQYDDGVFPLGSVVDAIAVAATQTIMKELRRQRNSKDCDPSALHRAIREIARQNLKEVPGSPMHTHVPASGPAVTLASASIRESVNANGTYSRGPCISPLVIRPRQACEMLSIGMTRLYELLNEGALESYKHAGSRRITLASINAYIHRQIVATASK